MWFLYALVTTLSWGIADLFYKKGANSADKFSHLKTTVAVGIVMGTHAIYTLISSGMTYDPINLLVYLPVSLCYILSMAVGYFGLRYLMLSVSSPVQNSSGALTCILCLLILGNTMDAISGVGVALICIGIFILGIFEKREYDRENTATGKHGFFAFMMPLIYCVIDALGTFLDAFYLDDFETTPLVGVTEDTLENTANISYELTFLLAALIIAVYIVCKGGAKQRILPVNFAAAAFETAGQATYVFAMSGNGAVAAPMIASYSFVSLLLSRLFLGEKLSKKQYAVIAAIIVGIALLGLAEGLAE